MVDGAMQESDLTPEERVDAAINSARSAQIGDGLQDLIERFDSGGGATGGHFVFADLAALDAVKGRWEALRYRIERRTNMIMAARDMCNPPADDMMSHYQANAGKSTLERKLEHNDAMLVYAKSYVDKLAKCRAEMATTEQTNSGRFRNVGGDLGHA